jgi:hypothetical protein
MTHARNTDPTTSHEAAASVTRVTDKRTACLDAIRELQPCTDEELAVYYARGVAAGRWPKQSQSGLRTRRSELTREGVLRDSGMCALTDSGRRSILWEIA